MFGYEHDLALQVERLEALDVEMADPTIHGAAARLQRPIGEEVALTSAWPWTRRRERRETKGTTRERLDAATATGGTLYDAHNPLSSFDAA